MTHYPGFDIKRRAHQPLIESGLPESGQLIFKRLKRPFGFDDFFTPIGNNPTVQFIVLPSPVVHPNIAAIQRVKQD